MLTVLILVNGEVIRESGLNFKLYKNGSMGAVASYLLIKFFGVIFIYEIVYTSLSIFFFDVVFIFGVIFIF